MCGINGFNFLDTDKINKMMTLTENRGPDAKGVFETQEMTLGHNRLSIIDLSKEANQPFNEDHLTIIFNGEIYNYKSLKEKLISKGIKFKTNSDTEVIIKLFKEYGEDSFKMLSGIFAIAIWNSKENELSLIRDIVGVKPLYYYHDINEKKFYFSSLIKSILLSKKDREINNQALNYYLNFWHNDLSETTFKKIYKVLPGELIKFKDNQLSKKKLLRFDFNKKLINPKKEIIRIFEKQLVSDVPVAISLSGGVDSNLIFSIMNKKIGNKFKTYSVRFEDGTNVDADVAKINSQAHNLENIQINVSHNDFIESLEKIVEILEEPVGNQNSIANYILSQKIGEKVLFTGDGGDEIFSGYNKYKSIFLLSILSKMKFLNIFSFLPSKNLSRLKFKNPEEFYLSFSEQNLMNNQDEYFNFFEKINYNDLKFNHEINRDQSILNNVMFLDIQSWIQNDSLVRNDKIFMNNGVEVRVPFLDQEMIELFLYTKDYKKIGFFQNNKPYIKKLFKGELNSLAKKKQGFDSPFSFWLQNKLFDFAKNILTKDYYDGSKYLNYDHIQNFIKNFKKDGKNPYLLWSLVVLQVYLKKFNF